MKRALLWAVVGCWSSMALGASVYQCQVSGQTVFQDVPCAEGAGKLRQIQAPTERITPVAPRVSAPSHDELTLTQRRLQRITQAAQPALAAPGLTTPPTPAMPIASANKAWAQNAEIALVATYGGARACPDGRCNGGNDPATPGARLTRLPAPASVYVTVDRPGKKVMLVLTSYEAVTWNVSATPTTQLSGVVFAQSSSSTGISQINTTAPRQKLALAVPYEGKGADMASALRTLDQQFGVRKIDLFAGAYRLEGPVRISQPAHNPEWTLEGAPITAPNQSIAFQLTAADGSAVDWTLTGPRVKRAGGYLAEGKKIFPPGPYNYEIASGSGRDCLAVVDKKTGARTFATLPPAFPECSWANDLTWDAKRNLVTVISFGGAGVLYRYDVAHQRWLDFGSMQDIDANSISYDLSRDRYLAWTQNGEILLLSANGTPQARLKVEGKLPLLDRVFRRDAGDMTRLSVFGHGEEAVLVAYSGDNVRYVWEYNIPSGRGTLTYKAPETQ